MGAMPAYVPIILAVGWLFWFLPFPLKRWNRTQPHVRDTRWRWGLLLQVIAYTLLWLGHIWTRHPTTLRTALAVVFLALSILLSWTATNALGRHLRFDAAVSPDHELVRTGAYSFIRHPIYASMLAILLGTGFLVTPPALFIPAIVIFIAGTEIRVHAEDNLLASHFGDEFQAYKRAVPAYIPLVR